MKTLALVTKYWAQDSTPKAETSTGMTLEKEGHGRNNHTVWKGNQWDAEELPLTILNWFTFYHNTIKYFCLLHYCRACFELKASDFLRHNVSSISLSIIALAEKTCLCLLFQVVIIHAIDAKKSLCWGDIHDVVTLNKQYF